MTVIVISVRCPNSRNLWDRYLLKAVRKHNYKLTTDDFIVSLGDIWKGGLSFLVPSGNVLQQNAKGELERVRTEQGLEATSGVPVQNSPTTQEKS